MKQTFSLAMKTRVFILSFILLVPVFVCGECTCEVEEDAQGINKTKARNLKIIAFAFILFFSAIGVCIPVLSKIFPACQPGKDFFFIIKAFAAGVILATGFIHVLPDAFEHLTSPCLKQNPWANFPFTGFIAMMATIGTLMIETAATSYFKTMHFTSHPTATIVADADGDEEKTGEHVGHVHLHTHATHGHAHGSIQSTDLLRHRVISQVLELGIVVHSVIIGISLGASENASTIKPLVIALCFHQFFEGIGLGGCISQAKFKNKAVIIMTLFFALTTPVGIAIGIGISSGYNENSPTALIVEGVLNSASAGILIYMALVDLLAADFMSDKVQSSGKLQFLAYLSLLGGAGSMSLLAKWA